VIHNNIALDNAMDIKLEFVERKKYYAIKQFWF
jgi:hypothetical protein